MNDLKKQVEETVSSAVHRIDDTKHQLDNLRDTIEHTHPISRLVHSISFASEEAEKSLNKVQSELNHIRNAYKATRTANDPIIEFTRLHPLLSSFSVSISFYSCSRCKFKIINKFCILLLITIIFFCCNLALATNIIDY